MSGNFLSDSHALDVGRVLGILMRQGLHAEPVVDAEGNYTPRILLHLDNADEKVTIELIVPPQPREATDGR